MTAFPSYSTGTVSVGAGATVIVGVGTIWSGVNARPGDEITIAGHTVKVVDVTDVTHLVIRAWPYTAVTAGTAYSVDQCSPQRFAGAQAMADVSRMIAALNTEGFYVFVPPALTVPDFSLGDDGQYAFQASTAKLWIKTGGAWVFQGIYKAFGTPAPWSSVTAYIAFDVVTIAGSSYICILANTNQTPPNATYWQLLASIGATGATGAGYGGTSTTSLAIGTGAKVFTTQANLAYNGARVRAASAANPANYMDGVCSYSGTTLTMTADGIGGSGTKTDWVFSVVGQPGNMTGANNLSEITNKATARGNIAAVLAGHLFGLTLSTAGATSIFGVTAGEAADSTNVDLLTLPSAYTKGSGAWAVGSGNGALDTGTIASGGYHVYLIKRPDTGVVDPLISLSPTAPTLPANYALFRRIGWMLYLGGAWVKFSQVGDQFLWSVPFGDAASRAVSATAILIQMTVPTGVKVLAKYRGYFSATNQNVLISSPDEADNAPEAVPGNNTFFSVIATGTTTVPFGEMATSTDTSGRVRARATGAGSVTIATFGWTDTRGRLA